MAVEGPGKPGSGPTGPGSAAEPALCTAHDARASRAGGEASRDARDAMLVRLIETEIVPRLLLSFSDRRERPRPPPPPSAAPRQALAVEFAGVLLGGDRKSACAFIRDVRRNGMPLGEVYLSIFAPAAKRLCGCWERGECTFGEVAPALIRLLSVLREVGGPSH